MTYVTKPQLRALPNLADVAKFTDAELDTAIAWFEAAFEDYTGVAFETRSVADERHYLTSSASIILNHLYPRTVSAVRYYSTSAASAAYTAGELADLRIEHSGVLRRMTLGDFTSAFGLVAVDYTHYKTPTPPPDVVEAAKVAIRAHLIDDYQANRQYAVSTEAGIIRTSQPGPDRPFGLPEVDAVANRRRQRTPAIA